MKNFSRAPRIMLLLLCFVMMFALTACSDNYPKPEETVKTFFEALSKSDFEKIKPLCLYSFGNVKFTDPNEEKIVKIIFSKTKGEVISSKVDGNTATVKVKITSADMSKAFEAVMASAMKKATDAALKGEEVNDKQVEEMIIKDLEESINKPDAPVVTKEFDIKLLKDKEKKAWVIDDNPDFGKALSGNIDEMMSGGKK